MGSQPANDRWIRKLAEAQHGVVARRQLLEGGMTSRRIQSWNERGRLVPVQRGVYALGTRVLRREGELLAAVLACGAGAALSHRTAAAVWGVSAPAGRIQVTVPIGGPRAPGAGIETHQSGIVAGRFVAVVDALPVTTLAWTLLDLAAVVRPHLLRRAVEAAEQLELFDLRAVEEALAADPRRTGSPRLRALLADMKDHGVTRTRSDVEAAMLQLCIDHALPRPQLNRYDNGVEVDFRWPHSGLIVEVDGWRFHRSRGAFAADRRRDREALASGWRVARFPASEVLREPAAVAAELSALLGHRW